MPIRKSSVSGSGGNDFVLSVGSSGNTTYALGQSYPAGSYTISTASDTTYDIYAIASDGTLVGYSNLLKLVTSDTFEQVVILGGSANEVFTFEYGGSTISATSKGDVVSAGAFVTSVATGSLPNIDDTVVVTGGNFANDVEAFFIDQADNEVAAKSIIRSSSTEIILTRPDSFDVSNSPYTIKVSNPGTIIPSGSNNHLLPNSITAGTNPVWQTPAAQTYAPSGANSITLVASDTEASDIDYEVISGTLPTGLTLDGETGVISGTPSGVSQGDQTIFTVRATDAGGNFVDREFTFTASGQEIYAVRDTRIFASHNSTNVSDTMNLDSNNNREIWLGLISIAASNDGSTPSVTIGGNSMTAVESVFVGDTSIFFFRYEDNGALGSSATIETTYSSYSPVHTGYIVYTSQPTTTTVDTYSSGVAGATPNSGTLNTSSSGWSFYIATAQNSVAANSIPNFGNQGFFDYGSNENLAYGFNSPASGLAVNVEFANFTEANEDNLMIAISRT